MTERNKTFDRSTALELLRAGEDASFSELLRLIAARNRNGARLKEAERSGNSTKQKLRQKLDSRLSEKINVHLEDPAS